MILRGLRQTVLAILLIFPTSQTEAETLIEAFGKKISDDDVRVFVTEGLKNIHLALCEHNMPCAPATAKDFDSPPISLEDGRAAMAHGIVSALAEWCRLDFKRSFLPMMVYGRHKMKMNDRSLALMALMHGNFQRRQLEFYQKKGQCPPQFRDQLDAQLPKF